MFINNKKTKSMLITKKRIKKKMNSDSKSSSLIINRELVERVDRHKFLGMVLDADLSYQDHMMS